MSKLFVLDTSVLLYDHNSILNFEEHDIVIPITVLEELDKFKKGNETKNFEARSVVRYLDKISEGKNIKNWIPLGTGKGRLKIVLEHSGNGLDAEKIYGSEKNDHKILNTALMLKSKSKKSKIVLISKDINLRIKAKAIGLESEDYLTGKIEDIENLSERLPVINDLDASIIKDIYQYKEIDENGILENHKVANGYYVLNNCTESALVRYNGKSGKLERVDKQYVYSIRPKNAEQTFAVDALLNQDIKLVAIEGVAGTGKTLLALAAALEQKNKFTQIILSRPIVPLSNRDIGFLPGDAGDKISPYMQPLWDNLKFIKSQFGPNEKKAKIVDVLLENGDIEITALAFIRGRSLANAYFIIDEAQNLTPHEVKTIITRAGEGTKLVFTGDIHQIDTPYLDEQSNGLSYIIDKLKGENLFAHVKLEKGERSELANLANRLL